MPIEKKAVRKDVPAEFVAMCDKHNIPATRRQLSKFRNNYGALARAAGTSDRRMPPGE